ncbi:MAG: helix-turn-helix domain-containing protein [Firmicutes bacterium]|nr:helix-turn-helix domain-containing protein [Candidatus Colivicinus equi]
MNDINTKENINKDVIEIKEIKLCEKYALPITDAAKYFNIGQHMLRELASISNNDYTLRVGTKILIKREKFEEYLNKRSVL